MMNVTKKIVSLFLCICLILGMTPLTAMAEVADCAHTHDAACGYVEGAPCGHVHDDGCGYDEQAGAPCAHTHDAACGYIEAVPCGHVHDNGCGPAPGDSGGSGAPPAPAGSTAKTVTAFAALDFSVWLQNVSSGAKKADLTLPGALTATIDGQEETISGVAWVCAAYDENTGMTETEYEWTPVLPEGYMLASGVTPPSIFARTEDALMMPMALPVGTAGESAGNPATTEAELRAAITAANASAAPNETIYIGGSGFTIMAALPYITKNLTILGPAAGVEIKVNGEFYHFYSVNAITLMLKNLTLTGRKTSVDDTTHPGGGVRILIPGATVIMENCTVKNCYRSGEGGGVCSETVNLTDCTLIGNTARDGGGVGATTANLTNCAVTDNMATGSYGTGGTGGGVVATTATLTNCTVSGNTARYDGGGVWATTATLTNCTVSGNSTGPTSDQGGGVGAYAVNLTNCTVTGNTATRGGGVYTITANIRGSIVAGNTAPIGNEVYIYGGGAWAAQAPGASNHYSIIGFSASLPGQTSLTDIFGTNTLANNGGPTQTIKINPNGPAMNGIPTSETWVPATDQRGTARPQGGAADIGAVETFGKVQPTLTLTATPPGPLTLPGNVVLTATLSGAYGGNAGKTVTFTVGGALQTATTNASGVASTTLTDPTAGSYDFGASYGGDINNFAATAPPITSYAVNLNTQAALSITGLGNNYTYGDASFALSTSGGSGSGAVTYTPSDASVASISGNTVTILKAGTFTVTATKAADSQYAAKSVTSSTVTVSQAMPNVGLSATGGANITDPIILTATVFRVGTGTTPAGTVTFSEGGTTLAANVVLNSSGVATFTVSNPVGGSHTYTVTYSGETDKYNSNNTNQTVGVGLTDQAALFITNPGAKTYGDGVFNLATTGGSGSGLVTFSVPAGNGVLAVASGGAVTIVGAGTVTVTARKAEDASYNEKTATLAITVAQRNIANVAVSVTGSRVYTGSQLQPNFSVSDGTIAITAADYTNDYGANVNAGTNAGSITLYGQRNYTGTKTVTFDIEKRSLAGAAITLAPGPYVYTGSALTPAVTDVVASGVTVPDSEFDVSYTDNGAAGTATVTVTAKTTSANFTGSASTTFTIAASYALTVSTNGSGVVFGTASGLYAENTPIILTAAPGGNYRFAGWTVNGVTVNTSNNPLSFTMPANAVTIRANFAYNGGTRISGGSGGSGGSTWQGSTLPTVLPFKWYTEPELNAATQAAKSDKLTFARMTYGGSAGIRKDLWKLLAGYEYRHDTMDSNAVEVRVTIPRLALITQDIYLSGRVKATAVDVRKAQFEKWFTNKIRVIHLEQQTPWGVPVEIAAKVDLTGMNTAKLFFYSYDKAKNEYLPIYQPNYWIDKNGYLHFTTKLAGDIIISEGPLQRR